MKKQNKITNSSQDKVNEPVITYEKTVAEESVAPEGYLPLKEGMDKVRNYISSDVFWKQQEEKTKEFCEKNGLL